MAVPSNQHGPALTLDVDGVEVRLSSPDKPVFPGVTKREVLDYYLAVGPRTFRPSPLGKLATAVFVVSCVVVMFFNYLGRTSMWVEAAIWISLGITLASWVDYAWRLARIINK